VLLSLKIEETGLLFILDRAVRLQCFWEYAGGFVLAPSASSRTPPSILEVILSLPSTLMLRKSPKQYFLSCMQYVAISNILKTSPPGATWIQ
jgi:hypothetical protein